MPFNHILSGEDGRPHRALLPGTVQISFSVDGLGVASEVREGSTVWLEKHIEYYHLLSACDDVNSLKKVALCYFQHFHKAMPELFNVMDNQALWRVPYYSSQGPDENLTEGIAMLMCALGMGRWRIAGVGRERCAGDVILIGPLHRAEFEQIVYGSFPENLQVFGVPGPGLCEDPGQHLTIRDLMSLLMQQLSPNEYGNGSMPSASITTPPQQSFRFHQPPTAPHVRQFRQPPRQPRQAIQHHAPRRYVDRDSDTGSSDPASGSSAEATSSEEEAPKRTRKTTARERTARRRSPSVEEYENDEPPRRQRAPTKESTRHGRGRGRDSDSDEVSAAAEKAQRQAAGGRHGRAAQRGSARGNRGRSPSEEDEDELSAAVHSTQRQAAGGRQGRAVEREPARRNRGRSPSDEEDVEPPAVDPAEKAKLEELKAANGYGKKGGKK
ncbi:MAG: hypothetical protein Q9219_002273 [cf. Caloplaca sp. 3 TL-2023]